jgi:hypothetical protein
MGVGKGCLGSLNRIDVAKKKRMGCMGKPVMSDELLEILGTAAEGDALVMNIVQTQVRLSADLHWSRYLT